MNWKYVHSAWALVCCPRKLTQGAQTLCIALLLLAATTSPARADCPAAPIADPDDMVISFLAANGTQAAAGSVMPSTVKEGMLVYDDADDLLKVCDGDNWIEVGSGSGTDTLAALSCSAGQIAKYNGSAWACATDGGVGGTEVAFRVTKSANQTITNNGSNQQVTWTTEAFDTNNNFVLSGDSGTCDGGSKKSCFKPTVAGRYIFTATANGANPGISSGTYWFVTIAKNGSGIATNGDTKGSSNSPAVAVSTIVDMNGTSDYVEVFVSSNDGSTITTSSSFSGALISGGGDILGGLSCTTGQIPKWNGTAWACAADGGGTSGPAIAEDFPDAILCGDGGTFRVLHLEVAPNSASQYVYRGRDNNFTTNYQVYFASNGSFANQNNLGGHDCINKSIATLYSEGKAFDFGGGGGSGGGGSGNTVAFSAHKNGTSQTVTSGVATLLDWTTERFDTNSNFDIGTGRFTPTVAGKYYFDVTMYCSEPATARCTVSLYKNGSAVYHSTENIDGTGREVVKAAGVIEMNGTTDYVDARAYLTGATTVWGGVSTTTFSGALFGGGSGSDTLSGLSCAAGDIPKWNGSAWACAADSNDGGASMTGAIMAFNASTCPDGWTEYTPARGRFLRGIDPSGSTTIDPAGTRAPGSTQDDEIKSHYHTAGNTDAYSSGLAGMTASGTQNRNGSTSPRFTGDTGGSETRPKNVAVIFCQYDGTGGLGGGGQSIFTFCTNANSDGNGVNDKPECVAAAANNGTGTAQYRAISCAEDGVRTGRVIQFNGTTWRHFADASSWINCTDGSVLVANLTAMSGGGGSAEPAGSVAGAIQFNDGSNALAADDVNLIWDDANNRLGIGTATPTVTLEVNGRGRLLSAAVTAPTTGKGLEFMYSSANDRGNVFAYDRDGAVAKDLGLGGSGSALYVQASGNVGIGTVSPDASALLDMTSTTRGFLPPRMTTTDRDNIASPAEGLVIYNTATKSLDLRVASSWLSFGGSMSGNTMFAGWPDAITCSNGTAVRVLYAHSMPGNTGTNRIYDSPTGAYSLTYTPAQAYSTHAGLSGYDCVTSSWSIAQLHANGKAFNFVGGATASADGSAGQLQFNEGGNLKADVALHWDNTNKRLGIGTASPQQVLHLYQASSDASLRVETDANGVATLSLDGAKSSDTHVGQIQFFNAGDSIAKIRARRGGADDAGALEFQTQATGSSPETRMWIAPSGSIGIGTSAPTSLLHVSAAQDAATALRIENSDSGTSARAILSVFSNGGGSINIQAPSTTFAGVTDWQDAGVVSVDTSLSGGLVLAHGGKVRIQNTAGTDAMAITGGNVGIGTATPMANTRLHVRDNNAATNEGRVVIQSNNQKLILGSRWESGVEQYSYLDSRDSAETSALNLILQRNGGYVGIGVPTPGYRLDLPNTASVAGRGRANSWTTYSDGRFKTDIESLDSALDKVMVLRGVSYVSTTETEGARQVGFIAQEVEKIVPEVVSISKTTVTMPDGSSEVVDDYRSLAYDRLVPVLTEAIKELKAENDKLRTELRAANDNDAARDAAIEALRREVDAMNAAR